MLFFSSTNYVDYCKIDPNDVQLGPIISHYVRYFLTWFCRLVSALNQACFSTQHTGLKTNTGIKTVAIEMLIIGKMNKLMDG